MTETFANLNAPARHPVGLDASRHGGSQPMPATAGAHPMSVHSESHLGWSAGAHLVDPTVWPRVLQALRIATSRAVVDSWLHRIEVLSITDEVVELTAADDQLRAFVAANYLQAVESALSMVLGRPVRAMLRTGDAATLRAELGLAAVNPGALASRIQENMLLGKAVAAPATPPTGHVRQGALDLDDDFGAGPTQPAPLSGDLPSRELDGREWQDLAPRFTFDSFVVGQANELAAAAATAVAEAPGQVYNPLFIHGGVGLGKTHLLHAIGQLARTRNQNLRVRYVAAETFIDDTLSAWRSRDGAARAEVRSLYRTNVDVLLVDDIQFLQGKTQIQEEFFHIFNALHQTGKQIVVTCDRFPSELQQFHDRLRSRFEWGLVAEIVPPDRELRVALLHRKAREMGMVLPIDVSMYLADHLRNNVRELEGALTKLSAHARIGKRQVDLALARSVLGPVIELPSRNLTAEVIQRVTAQQFSLKLTDLKGQKRHRSVVVPRMIAIYLTRKHTSMSFPDIGRAFGGRDHSTAIHACQRIEWQLTTDPDVQAAVQAIETALGK